MNTLAEAWEAHAARTLPNDCSTAQVARARRDFYFAEHERLRLLPTPRSTQDEALFQESLGFARTIGRPEEMAT